MVNLFSAVLPHWITVAHGFVDQVSWIKTGIGLITGVGAAYKFFTKRLNDKEAEIGRLTAEQEGLRTAYSYAQADLRTIRDEQQRLLKQTPDQVLCKVAQELGDHNFQPAHLAVKHWLDDQGEVISRLLVWRARWVLAHAAGDLTTVGLLGAQAYARAAATLWPQNEEAQALLGDASSMLQEHGQPLPPLREALVGFDEHAAATLYRQGEVDTADTAEDEAWRCYHRFRYAAALSLIEWVVPLRLRNQGRHHPSTFATMYLHAAILRNIGHFELAKDVAEALIKARSTHQGTDPYDEDGLLSYSLLVNILILLDRFDGALVIAREVVAHRPDDLVDRHTSRFDLSIVLGCLRRYAEALAVAVPVLAARENDPNRGPDHPSTVFIRYHVASILHLLGRHQEALPLASAAADAQTADSSSGLSNTDTRRSIALVASILEALGRHQEALPLKQAAGDWDHIMSPAPYQPGTIEWTPEANGGPVVEASPGSGYRSL